jgi:hypothetical protein
VLASSNSIHSIRSSSYCSSHRKLPAAASVASGPTAAAQQQVVLACIDREAARLQEEGWRQQGQGQEAGGRAPQAMQGLWFTATTHLSLTSKQQVRV